MKRTCSDRIEVFPTPQIAQRLADAAAHSGRSVSDELLHQIDAALAAMESGRSTGLTVDT